MAGKAIKAFQQFVYRKLILTMREGSKVFGPDYMSRFGRETLRFQYRLQTPLSAVMRPVLNPLRAVSSTVYRGETSASRSNRQYRPY